MSNANQSSHFNAIIIGCGKIAGGYDENTKGNYVRTHAKAYQRHPNYTLAACVDPDQTRREAFMDYWNIGYGYSQLTDALANGQEFDVASICTPTQYHSNALMRLMKTSVSAVLCEKPLTDNLEQAKSIVDLYDKSEKLLAVNYMRRWTPELAGLKQLLSSGECGALQAVTAYYTKGLKNNGSHMIDLLMHILDRIEPGPRIRQQVDYVSDDPTIDAILYTKDRVPIYLIGLDSRNYMCFEFTLLTEKGIISVEDSGYRIRYRRSTQDERYPSQNHIDRGTWRDTDLGQSIYAVVENIFRALTNQEYLISNGTTALATQMVVEGILSAASADRSN